jgi:hypothetical protein
MKKKHCQIPGTPVLLDAVVLVELTVVVVFELRVDVVV